MHHLILIAALLAPVAHATELPDAIRRIILPQAMRVVLPPLGNEFIGMVRATSLASVIQYPEVLYTTENIHYVNSRVIELPIVTGL